MRRAVYAQRLPLEHSGGPGLARRAVLRMGGRAWQGGFEVEMSEPYSIFTGLPLPELESLRADITSYVQARHAKPIRSECRGTRPAEGALEYSQRITASRICRHGRVPAHAQRSHWG